MANIKVDTETLIYFRDRIREHQYRPWVSPPPGKEDICGSCGCHKDEHPTYWLNVGSVADQKRMGAFIRSLSKDLA